MVEYAWIIKHKDKDAYGFYSHSLTEKLCMADIFETEGQAFSMIKDYGLVNCKPVKIKIEVVEE